MSDFKSLKQAEPIHETYQSQKLLLKPRFSSKWKGMEAKQIGPSIWLKEYSTMLSYNQEFFKLQETVTAYGA